MRHGNFKFNKTKFFTYIIGKFILPTLSTNPLKIIYKSHFAKNYYENIGYKNNSIVINNGFSDKFYKPIKSSNKKFKNKYSISQDTFIMGYVARFNPQKNHKFLFSTLKELKKNFKYKFKLVLIGGNIQNNYNINKLISKYNLNSEVIILRQSNKINTIYPIFDISFQVSSYGESFPNIIAESMLCGVPCIASNTGESYNIIKKSGYLFKTDDQKDLLRAIKLSFKDFKNKHKWSKLKLNCRKIITKYFSIKKMIIEYNKLIYEKY